MTHQQEWIGKVTEDGRLSLTVLIPIAAVAALTADHMTTPFDAIFAEIGTAEGVGPDLLKSIARYESGFRTDAVSPPNRNGTRDYGLMQMNNITATALGADPARFLTPSAAPDLQVVRYAVRTAAKFIRGLWRELGPKANLYTVIAAYNAGSPAIKKRGIFNSAYVMSVLYHHQLYTLAGVIRGRA